MRFGGTSGRASALAVAVLALLAAPQLASAAGSGSFSPTGSMSGPRLFHAAAPLQDGRVLVVGGSPDGSPLPGLATTEIYNPATGTFVPGPSMGTIRKGPVAAPLKNGLVLVAGGKGPLTSAQIYDPATNSFSATGFMGDGREGAGGATLPDGRVLVVGGSDGVGFLDTAEIWDPATNLWTPTDGMDEQRYTPAVAQLPDGKILVVGGYGPGLHDSAEIFNPATETFGPAGTVTLENGVRGAAAAPLPDGRVLVAGGDQAGGNPLSFAEAYDPLTGGFSPAGIGQLGTARAYAAAAALGDGRVLVTGGSGPSGIERSAEVYAATNTFTYAVSGKKLLVTVQAPGKVDLAAGAGDKGKAAATKKRKRRALLRPASASGGPGAIELPLLLTKAAKRKLRQTGKVKLPASITFSPVGGVANTQSAKLKLKRKRKP